MRNLFTGMYCCCRFYISLAACSSLFVFGCHGADDGDYGRLISGWLEQRVSTWWDGSFSTNVYRVMTTNTYCRALSNLQNDIQLEGTNLDVDILNAVSADVFAYGLLIIRRIEILSLTDNLTERNGAMLDNECVMLSEGCIQLLCSRIRQLYEHAELPSHEASMLLVDLQNSALETARTWIELTTMGGVNADDQIKKKKLSKDEYEFTHLLISLLKNRIREMGSNGAPLQDRTNKLRKQDIKNAERTHTQPLSNKLRASGDGYADD